MPVTVLDVIVIVVVLISAVLAMVRGFVREVLSVASWVAAAAAAYFFYKPVIPLLEPYIASKTVQTIVAAGSIFFIALIVASYITMKISDFVIDSRIGAVDRAFGFIFGAVRGILLLVIALLFFNWLVPSPPAWVSEARSKPMLDDIGERIMAALPEDAEAAILSKIRGASGGEAGGDAAPPDAAEDAPATPGVGEPGYEPGSREGLDQLIENTDPGEAAPGD
jgi:membrane protein required for colicin V production